MQWKGPAPICMCYKDLMFEGMRGMQKILNSSNVHYILWQQNNIQGRRCMRTEGLAFLLFILYFYIHRRALDDLKVLLK